MFDKKTIVVTNIHPNMTREIFISFFKNFGYIESFKLISKNASQINHKFAFIQYRDRKNAAFAMKKMQFKEIFGWEISISYRLFPKFTKSLIKLNIDNIPFNIKTTQLIDYLSYYGDPVNCVILRDYNGNNIGYAFANFINSFTVNVIIKNLNGKKKWGNVLIFSKGNPKQPEIEPTYQKPFDNGIEYNGIVIYNVRSDVDQETIKYTFSIYGNIKFVNELNIGEETLSYHIVFKTEQSAIDVLKGYKNDKKILALIDWENTGRNTSFIKSKPFKKSFFKEKRTKRLMPRNDTNEEGFNAKAQKPLYKDNSEKVIGKLYQYEPVKYKLKTKENMKDQEITKTEKVNSLIGELQRMNKSKRTCSLDLEKIKNNKNSLNLATLFPNQEDSFYRIASPSNQIKR